MDEEDEHFINHKDRLCQCTCSACVDISPHPVHNCKFRCKEQLTMDEKTINKLGMNQPCMCQCSDCIRMPGHNVRDCYEFCATSPFTK